MADRLLELRRSSKSGRTFLPAAKRITKRRPEAEDKQKNQHPLKSSPVEKILQNSLGLQNIFKFLPYNDLLTCQLVDQPQLSSAAEHSTSHRPLLNILLQNSKITMVKTFKGKKNRFEFENIPELIIKLNIYEKGHEIWLTVLKIDLASKDLKQFLKVFANFITTLDLSSESLIRISPSDLQKLLVDLPNLSHLRLDSVPSNWKLRNEKVDPSILLPQVQTIFFRHLYNLSPNFYPTLIEGLLKVMPNLKNIHKFPLSCIEALGVDDNNKLNLGSIKSVDVFNQTIVGAETQDKLLELANIGHRTKLRIAQLSLKIWPPSNAPDLTVLKSCYESLSSILWTNKDTLENLTIKPMFRPHFLEYPSNMKVKKLCLFSGLPANRTEGKILKFFQEEFNFSKTFPNLTEVTLQGASCSWAEFLTFFPEDVFFQNNFQGVASLNLEFSNYGGLETMKKVAALYPNVTKFSMDSSPRDLEMNLPHIFQLWPKVRNMKLKVDLTDIQKSDEYLLDPVFTGISSANCSELREHKKKRTDIDLKSYQENLGISAMTGLEELTLIFHCVKPKIPEVVPLFSHVTPFYGFQCLPDLRVTCAIPWDDDKRTEIKEMLSPIKDHVIFDTNF